MHNSFPNNFGAGPFLDFRTGSCTGSAPVSGGGLGVAVVPFGRPFVVGLLFWLLGCEFVLFWFGNKNVPWLLKL